MICFSYIWNVLVTLEYERVLPSFYRLMLEIATGFLGRKILVTSLVDIYKSGMGEFFDS